MAQQHPDDSQVQVLVGSIQDDAANATVHLPGVLRHKDKMDTHSKQRAIAGEAGLPFVKVPLVFEITGAMGKETQKWWREVAALEKEQRGQETTSRKDKGLDWTFSANGFASYWLQAISMSMARTLAESVVMFIGKNQKEGIFDVHPEINTN